MPGSIQPHGLLLAVDPATERVLQVAGGAAALLGLAGPLAGRAVRELLGTSLVELAERTGAGLPREPRYLGTVAPADAPGPLTVIAHRNQGAAIVEVMPAGRSAAAADTLASIRSITERIGDAADLLEACRFAASEIRRISGYDRVMIYRFLPDGSGSVIVEQKDAGLPPFRNHRYPACDIPRQARELYRRSAIRVIPDVRYTPAPLVPKLSPATKQPLDMSHCTLRSVSPVHIRYLENMGVGASMSVSLLPRGELWGLIACHNATPRPVPFEAQEACRHTGQILSQRIRALEDAEADRVAHELAAARDKVMGTLTDTPRRGAAISDACPELQAIVRSDGVAVSMKAGVVAAGRVPPEPALRQLAAWLEPRLSGVGLFLTDRLPEEFSAAAEWASVASGLLALRLAGAEPVVVMWFRIEQVQEVMWAGNPHEPLAPGSRPGVLNPRASFATWMDTVKGRCRPWDQADADSAQAFGPRATVFLQQQKVNELNDQLAEVNERLASLASTDGLTGIANRRAFDQRLRQEWARARRSGGSLALITLDLDFFKQYNDCSGHPTGDECLKQVARLLQDGRRAADFAARIGGEEFSLLLPDTDFEGAEAVAETARRRIEELRIDHPKSDLGVITASLGVGCVRADGKGTAHDLMKAADRALYDAKTRGRNRVARDGGR